MDKIILNIPHSSNYFPENQFDWDNGIEEYIEKWTDKFTDKLFSSVNTDVISYIFPYSRFYCDFERLIDDPLNKIGQGIVYTEFEGIKRNINQKQIDNVMDVYNHFMGGLQLKLQKYLDDGYTPILIDCHSFPKELSDVDICLGINDDWSQPNDKLLDLIIKHFSDYNLTVGVNTPYSNSIAPIVNGTYTSFMIEINKGLYLNSKNEFSSFAYKYHLMFESLYKKILNFKK